MKRILCALLCVLLITSIFLSCSTEKVPTDASIHGTSETNETDTEPPTPPSYDDGSVTLCLYVCGNNLETKQGSATKNIAELLSAELPDNVTVLIQTGGTRKWRNYGISSDTLSRYTVKDGDIDLLETCPNASMGDGSTLAAFLKWAADKYPAEQNGLILWDHGGGSLDGVCYDELYGNDALTLCELDTALAEVYAITQRKYEFIGFDACLMATYETALTLAPYAENMVASEEKEPSGGWNYKALAENIGKEGFYDVLLSTYAEKSARKNYYTLSHIDLNTFSDVIGNFDALLDRMSEETPRNLIGSVQRSTAFGSTKDNLYDLGNILSYFGIAYNWSDAVRCVNGETRQNATGLSLYFPLYDDKNIGKYKDNCKNDRYADMISEFYRNRTSDKIAFQSYAEAKENKLSFVLQKTSIPYLSEVEYFLISPGDMGALPIVYGSDDDYNLNGSTVTIDFEGRWVSFGGQLLYVTVKERRGEQTIYESPLFVNDSEAFAYFSFDGRTRQLEFMGVTYTDDDHGRMYTLTAGDKIIPITCEAEQDYYIYSYSPENAFTYSDDTEIQIVALPNGYYQYTAFVKDVYGNTFSAGTAVVEVKDGKTALITVTDNEVEYPERIY